LYFHSYILFTLLCCNNNSVKTIKRNADIVDSVYVRIDSSTIDINSNTYDVVLYLRLKGKVTEIFRKQVQDEVSEFSYSYSYSDSKKSYLNFAIENLAVGNSMYIIYNNENHSFFKTEWTSTMIIDGSVDFGKLTLNGIELNPPNCGSIVKLKLFKLTPS